MLSQARPDLQPQPLPVPCCIHLHLQILEESCCLDLKLQTLAPPANSDNCRKDLHLQPPQTKLHLHPLPETCNIQFHLQILPIKTSTHSLCQNLQLLYPPQVSGRKMHTEPPPTVSTRNLLPPPPDSARKLQCRSPPTVSARTLLLLPFECSGRYSTDAAHTSIYNQYWRYSLHLKVLIDNCQLKLQLQVLPGTASTFRLCSGSCSADLHTQSLPEPEAAVST